VILVLGTLHTSRTNDKKKDSAMYFSQAGDCRGAREVEDSPKVPMLRPKAGDEVYAGGGACEEPPA